MDAILTWRNLITVIVFIALYIGANKVMQKLLDKHNNLTNTFLANALKVIIIIVGIVVLLSQYSEFTDAMKLLTTNSAVLVAVVGFALQSSIKNVIAGTLLLSSDTFKIGDRIRIPKENISGEIEELTLRHAKIKIATSERAIIPNSLLNDAIVINNNLNNEETCYPLVVPVSTKCDVYKAKQIVEDLIENHPEVLKERNYMTVVTTLKDDSFELKTMIWTKDLETSFRTLSELRSQVIEKFQQEGIYD